MWAREAQQQKRKHLNDRHLNDRHLTTLRYILTKGLAYFKAPSYHYLHSILPTLWLLDYLKVA